MITTTDLKGLMWMNKKSCKYYIDNIEGEQDHLDKLCSQTVREEDYNEEHLFCLLGRSYPSYNVAVVCFMLLIITNTKYLINSI